MRRFYKVAIHPIEDDNLFLSQDGCPNPPKDGSCPDCNSCEYLKYIGTFGGDFYVDCVFDENEN